MIEKLNAPYDARSYQGTVVKVLPSSDYPKKYWNKKHYVERETDLNGHAVYYIKELIGGDKGWYGPVFCCNAIENIHFVCIKIVLYIIVLVKL